MSASAAITMVNPRIGAEAPERHPRRFQVVATRAQRAARPRVFYAMVTVAVIFGIIIAQLLLSVAVSSGAYEISGLRSHNKELGRTQQSMAQDLDRRASPQNLSANAEALGMVNNNTPAYLRLSDGAVLGSPEAATAAAGVTGEGTLVANSLLNGVPLVTTIVAETVAASASANAATNSLATAPSVAAPVAPTGPVPLTNGLPGMSTH